MSHLRWSYSNGPIVGLSTSTRPSLKRWAPPTPSVLIDRELLGDAVQQVVVSAAVVANLVPTLGIAPADQDKFAQLLREELQHLETYNCARYRLGLALTDKWIAAGRPGL